MRLGVAFGVIFAVALAAFGGGATATARQLSFLASAKGTVVVTWSLNGNLDSGRCRADAAGTGRETFAFSTVRPQLVGAVPNGRLGYLVWSDFQKPAPLRVKATRAGTLEVTLSGSGGQPECQAPGTVTAPTSGCGAASGRSRYGYGVTAVNTGGSTGARRGTFIEIARLGDWGSQFTVFPWLKKLDPCPSSFQASLPPHLGNAWWQGRLALGWGGGGVAYEKTGANRLHFPTRVWTKRAFTTSTTFTRAYRAFNTGFRQIGKETQTVAWKITFKRR